jgi:alanyl aminopeptidase
MYRQRILLAWQHADAALTDARGCPTWLLANDEAAGYYRVRYEGGLLDRLLANGGGELSVAERVSELGNVNALVGTGDVPPARALALVPEFSGDPNSEVVELAMETASTLKGPEVPDGLRPNAARYIRGVFARPAESLGWHSKAGDGDEARLLRSKLTPFAAAEGLDRTLIDGAGSLARQWLKDRSGVEPDMLPAVLSVAAQFGDRSLWDLIHQQALTEKDPAIRERLLAALGSFRDRTLAEASLRLLLAKEFDTREAFFPLLFGPLDHAETRDLPFGFVRANLDALVALLPREVDSDFGSYLPFTANAFCDATHREEVDSFFHERVKGFTGGERTLRNALEIVDVCIARKKALGPSIAEFLKGY